MPPQVIVVATHNAHKAGEMIQILGPALPEITFKDLSAFPGAPEPDETAPDYAGNAEIKAVSAAKHTGHWCLADDAGLEIDALPGELGPHSKRFAGEETPFPEKMAMILSRMRGLPTSERDARFVCHVCLAAPDGRPKDFSATCEGVIAEEMSGGHGFGYDPIFHLPQLGCTMAELPPERKHEVSHRGKVLAQVIQALRQM